MKSSPDKTAYIGGYKNFKAERAGGGGGREGVHKSPDLLSFMKGFYSGCVIRL